MRDAPSIPLITALQDMGARVQAYDPEGMAQAREVLFDVDYADNAYDCARGADVLVIVTEWEQFRALDFSILKTVMARPVIVDLRNIYPPEEVARHGFAYTGIGRGISAPVTEDDNAADAGLRDGQDHPGAACSEG
jgi:UDPglucose 6-dehydrogenase